MTMSSNHYDSMSFQRTPAEGINGFIQNVDKDLRQFHHVDRRSVTKAYLLGVFLGMFGAHHFYLDRRTYGVMYLFTFGLFGFGYVVDLFRMRSLVKAANLRLQNDEHEKTLLDAYVLWFPFGIFGFHRFYLHHYTMGILYMFTLGICGIGWLMDAYKLPEMIEYYNRKSDDKDERDISLAYAYLFSLPPFGILGFHHYYLHRTWWGIFYTLTLGSFFIGWMLDFVRMPFLVTRIEKKRENVDKARKIHVDDVYIIWVSLGFVGFHHIYLKRYRWALIYALTFGLFGVGWMADLFRIPRLVKQLNIQAEEGEDVTKVVSDYQKRKESNVSSIFVEQAKFDDVMHQKKSPRRFHINGVREELGKDGSWSLQHVDNVDEPGEFPIGQLKRTMSSESATTNTVSIEPEPPHSHGGGSPNHTEHNTSSLNHAAHRNVIPQKWEHRSASPNLRNANADRAKQNERHDLLSNNRDQEHHGVLPNDTHSRVQTNHTYSRVQTNTNRTDLPVQTNRTVSINEADLHKIKEFSKRQKLKKKSRSFQQTHVHTESQKCELEQESEQNTESCKSLGENINTISNLQLSGIKRTPSSNSRGATEDIFCITNIDVNRIPTLNDSFDDETITPRSNSNDVLTPRSDDGTGNVNSLPRVIKVKKSKSMEQMKRSLRRSMSKRRQRTAVTPVEDIAEEAHPEEPPIQESMASNPTPLCPGCEES